MTEIHKKSHSTIDIKSRYQRAKSLIRGGDLGSKTVAFNTTIHPQWMGDTDCFWYRRETRTGQDFRVIDARQRLILRRLITIC